MTREDAIKVSRALDAIDLFESLADSIENVVDNMADDVPDIAHFKWELSEIIEKEFNRRKKVLEEL